MTDVPDEAIPRRIEDMVQSDRQFDNAEPRPQVPPRDGDRFDGLASQFVRDAPQIRRVVSPQILWALYVVQHTASGFWRFALGRPAMAF